ncbi:avidin-like [Phaenicophaeus curvirostris]|uniref:avidin-like n=1 Tax=Phaenicophaeus curvirostris TaxID=33595 RepID=UPI0037F0F066
MEQVTPFLLVLSLALVAPGLFAGKCNLTGSWINDLGSNMTIWPIDKEGNFNGIYYTAVKDTPNDPKRSPLLGSQQPSEYPTFGFTVNWTFTDSVTVFTGQCFVDEDGKEILKTMWLLRSHENSIKDDWKATRVGYNNFTRIK